MTILTIPKKQFEKEIGKLDDKMQEEIAMFGTPIEGLTDDELQIEIFPNRPDLLSYQNYKNAKKAFLGKGTGLKKINIKKSGEKLIVENSLPKQWPYAFAFIVKGLKFDDEKIKEIIDIQEKLGMTLLRKRKKGGIGIYPLEKITFPIKFKGMGPDEIKFRPLEYPVEITGRQILSKHPTGREYGDICKGWERFPVFIDSKKVIMSMPPIINSHDVGKIDETTKDIFVEATGTDANVLKAVLNILAISLTSVGGKIYSIECVQQDKKTENIPDLTPEKMKISIENTNKLLGLELTEKQVKEFLEKMGYDYNKGVVSVPAYRADVLHEVDLIEDIAIAYGYGNFKPEIPEVSTIGQADKKEIVKDKIANILAGLGFLETSSYHLTTKRDQIKKMGLKGQEFVEVKESKTEYTCLRKDLTHYLLKIFGENVDVEYPQEIFQVGKVFEGYKEKESLAIALCPGNFTRLKQVVEYLGRMLGVEFEVVEPSGDGSGGGGVGSGGVDGSGGRVEVPKWFIEGRCAEVKLGGESIGFFGEVHPRVLKNFKVKMGVALGEINMEKILNH